MSYIVFDVWERFALGNLYNQTLAAMNKNSWIFDVSPNKSNKVVQTNVNHHYIILYRIAMFFFPFPATTLP